MKLRIGNFYIKDIVFGDKTVYKDGVLTVNKKEAIAALNKDGGLKDIDLHIARPGESVRIVPVRAAVEPRIRPDGRAVFPGYTGELGTKLIGEGDLYALKNMCVLSVGSHGGASDGMVDMSGPGAELTHFSRLIHLVITAENVDGSEDYDQFRKNTYYRKAGCRLAEYLASTVKEQEPEDWETFDLTDVTEKKLP